MTQLEQDIHDAVGRIPVARRANVDQLLLDLTGIWVDRYHRGMCAMHDPDLFPVVAAGLSDAWTVLYLLGKLRTHAPQEAEECARFLNLNPVPADHLPVYAHEWHLAIEEGRSLLGLLP